MKEFSEIAKSAHISNDAIVEYPIHCGPNSQIHGGCNVGQFTFINISSVLYPNVKIGRFCSIARNCEIGVARHPVNFLSTHSFQYHFAQFPKHPFYKNGINRTSGEHIQILLLVVMFGLVLNRLLKPVLISVMVQ